MTFNENNILKNKKSSRKSDGVIQTSQYVHPLTTLLMA